MDKLAQTIRDDRRRQILNRVDMYLDYDTIKTYLTKYVKQFGVDLWVVDLYKRNVHIWRNEQQRLENPVIKKPFEFG